jgi:hypothetical protein
LRLRSLLALLPLAALVVAGCGSKEEGVSDPNDPMIGQKAATPSDKGANPSTAEANVKAGSGLTK